MGTACWLDSTLWVTVPGGMPRWHANSRYPFTFVIGRPRLHCLLCCIAPYPPFSASRITPRLGRVKAMFAQAHPPCRLRFFICCLGAFSPCPLGGCLCTMYLAPWCWAMVMKYTWCTISRKMWGALYDRALLPVLECVSITTGMSDSPLSFFSPWIIVVVAIIASFFSSKCS